MIHSFWARQLGCQGRRQSRRGNVAYVRPTEIGKFDIKCAELCGLFHGHMFDTGKVVGDAGSPPGSTRSDASSLPRPAIAPVSHSLPAGTAEEGRMNAQVATRPLWRRVIGFNLLTGIVLGVVGFYIGWWLGHQIHAKSLEYFADTNQNDVALMLGYIGFVVGFVIGLGFARYPLARLAGR